MNIDKDIIGKPPNQAVVINEQLIKRAESYKQEDEQELLIINGDSREKLESEIAEKVCSYEKAAGTWHPELMECTYDNVLHWLDRQAAITEREIYKREQFHEKTQDMVKQIETQGIEIDGLIAERDGLRRALETQEHLAGQASRDYLRVLDRADKLQEQVDSLTAERNEFADELKLDAIALDELRKQVDELTTERDHLKKVVQQQAESFRKMEVELSKAKAVSNECDR